ncbi:Leucine Rich Repeat family protein [Histomonas meleagridis]|uniref:Leucine Rich Repeat family protein n=1 Tax=Histomonas meleagridis TaxID=135588 RepID=UPI0035593F78|nr:Leucine Rich Repeat family protein [Histomonas meleagridis]KAH0796930.1 Leucine Rich Repeat family protein [Histomonas meleagridis]
MTMVMVSPVNGEPVKSDQINQAFHLSPIVGYALRKGRDPTPQPDEKHSSLAYLTNEQPLQIQNLGGFFMLRCPKEGNSVTWYISSLSSDEWTQLDCSSRTLPITPAMSQHLIRCDLQSDSGIISFYTDDVLMRDESLAVIPYHESLNFVGDKTVGSIVSLSSSPHFSCHISWNLGNNVLEENSKIFIIPDEAQGKLISVKVTPIHPSFPNILFSSFSTDLKISDSVELEINQLSIPNVVTEGEPFDITLETFPVQRTVPIRIESSDSFVHEFKVITTLNNGLEYTPTKDDSNRILRVSAFVSGRYYYSYTTSPVQPIISISKSIIAGSYQTNHPHVVLLEFSDGNTYPTSFSWFTQLGSEEPKIYLHNDTQTCIPTDDAADLYLGVEIFTHLNGKEQRYNIITPQPITLDQNIIDVPHNEEAIENDTIIMQDNGNWLISDIDSRNGFQLIEENANTFIPNETQRGKFLRFTNDFIDIIFGKIHQSLSPIQSIKLKCLDEPIVGSLVQLNVTFYTKENNDSYDIKWIRCSRNKPDKIIQEEGRLYCLTSQDYGCKIKARIIIGEYIKDSNVTPMIKRGLFNSSIINGKLIVGNYLIINENVKPTKIKWMHVDDKINEVLNETNSFELKYFDIDHRIHLEIEYKGKTYHEFTNIIEQNNVYQDQIINIEQIFHKINLENEILWFRYDFQHKNWKKLNTNKLSYRLTKDDIDSVIRIIQINENSDEVYADISSILPYYKAPQKPKIVLMKNGNLKIDGNFIENRVKSMKFQWKHLTPKGFEVINGLSSRIFENKEMFEGEELIAGYKFAETNDFYWSESYFVGFNIQKPKCILIEPKKILIGTNLKCKIQNIKKDLKCLFEWKRFDGNDYFPLKWKNSKVYVVSEDDVGYFIGCEVCFVDENGKKGPPEMVMTSSMVSDEEVLTIKGLPVCGSIVEVQPIEENCLYQWQRLDNNEWIPIKNKTSYRCCVEDIGHLIRVVSASNENEKASQEFGPIAVDSNLKVKANSYLRRGVFQFKGIDQKNVNWLIETTVSVISFKSKTVSRTSPWNDVMIRSSSKSGRAIDIVSGSKLKITIIPKVQNEITLNQNQVRDLCLLIMKTFKAKSNT